MRIFELDVPHDFRNRPHHVGGYYRSPPSPHSDGRRSAEMAKVLLRLAREGNKEISYTDSHCMSREDALACLHQNKQENKVTWLGHASFAVNIDDLCIVTDPFLSQRASPFAFSGPKRLVPAPLQLDDLNPDILIISHNHYDHLDAPTLRAHHRKHSVKVIVPLGLRPIMASLGYTNIVELDWYHSIEILGCRITALPAYHFSGRFLWDQDKTLWASFAISRGGKKIYFAGDTGYGPAFKQIGDLTGPYDLALTPIGAYGPREVFARVHGNPEEAVKMAQDLRAKHSVGMHWGTIRLTTEPFWEPRSRFLSAVENSGISGNLMRIGETIAWESWL